MNVCGNRTSMSKGLYLIARKIASRWEYDREWEGGDPTQPRGQGLPASAQSRGMPDGPDFDDPSSASYRRRGGRRNLRPGERDSRDGRSGRRDDDDDMGRSGGRDGMGGSGGGGRDVYGRGGPGGGGGFDGGMGGLPPGAQPKPGDVVTPWRGDPSFLANVVGPQAAAAAGGAGGPSGGVSSVDWARIIAQMPPAARDTLGITPAQLAAAAAAAATGGAPAGDVYGRALGAGGAVGPQQQAPPQQPPQVRMALSGESCSRVTRWSRACAVEVIFAILAPYEPGGMVFALFSAAYRRVLACGT